MAGTIIINKSRFHDLRTVDFSWLASELRAKTGTTERVLAKVLWPHDEGGMDVLQADELEEEEFKLFAQAIGEVLETSRRAASGSAGMTQFLELLLRSIEDDPRY